MKNQLYSLVLAFVLLYLVSSNSVMMAQWCGAEASENWSQWVKENHEGIRQYQSNFLSNSLQNKQVMREIPITFHKIRRADGTVEEGDELTEENIQNYIEVINDVFSPINVSFYKKDVNNIDDSNYYPLLENSYTPEVLISYFSLDITRLYSRHNHPNGINIYFSGELNAGSTGTARFPDAPPGFKGCIEMKYGTAPSVLVHEIGHVLGILHTFGRTNACDHSSLELVDGSNCKTAGDFICDTPASPGVCGEVDSNCNYNGDKLDPAGFPYQPDTQNVMEYVYGDCPRNEFTEGQYAQMAYVLNELFPDWGTTETDDQGYCTQSVTFPEHAWISGLEVGDFKNTSTYNEENGYQDFTNQTIKVPIGQLTKVKCEAYRSCTPKNLKLMWQVLIDLNGDGDFYDSGESVYNSMNNNILALADEPEFLLRIPHDVPPQKTRMRVLMRIRDNHILPTLSPFPCEDITKGEVEDYEIEILAPDTSLEVCVPEILSPEYPVFIDLFRIGSYSNVSGKNFGYASFSDLPIGLKKGKNYLVYNTYQYYCSPYEICSRDINSSGYYWLDLNNDGFFSADEEQRTSIMDGTYAGSHYKTLHIPDSYAFDKIRIRICNTSTAPCGISDFGECEDYVFDIEESDGKEGEIIFLENNLELNGQNDLVEGITKILIGNQEIEIPSMSPDNLDSNSEIDLELFKEHNMNIIYNNGADYTNFRYFLDVNQNGYCDVEDKVNELQSDVSGVFDLWIYKVDNEFTGNTQVVKLKIRFTELTGYECNFDSSFEVHDDINLYYNLPKNLPLSPVVSRGESYNIQLNNRLNSNTELIWYVWLDANEDGDYEDTGEKLYESDVVKLSDEPNFELTIPNSLSVGEKKLLIQQCDSETAGLSLPLSCQDGASNGLKNSEFYIFSVEAPLLIFETPEIAASNGYIGSRDIFLIENRSTSDQTTINSDASWYEISIDSGSNDPYNNYLDGALTRTTFRGNYEQNLDFERTANITISNPHFEDFHLTVLQKGAPIVFTKSTIEFPTEGGENSFKIVNPDSESISLLNQSDWIETEITPDGNDFVVTLQTTPNFNPRYRSINLWFSTGEIRRSIEVYQSGNDDGFFETQPPHIGLESILYLPPEGGDTTISVSTNLPFYFTRVVDFSSQEKWLNFVIGDNSPQVIDTCSDIVQLQWKTNISGKLNTAWINFLVQDESNDNFVQRGTVTLRQEPFEFEPVNIENLQTSNLKIYPNPGRGVFYIQTMNNDIIENAAFRLYSITGKPIQEFDYSIHRHESTIQLELGNLPQGVYIFQLSDQEKVYAGKIVKE